MAQALHADSDMAAGMCTKAIVQGLKDRRYMLEKIKKDISKTLSSKDKQNSQLELQILLKRARTLAEREKIEALKDLQRLLIRPIQSNHMLDAYLRPDHRSVTSFDEWRDFGLNYIPGIEQSFIKFVQSNCKISREKLPAAKLGRDSILPTCWSPSSIVNMLGSIGDGRKCGPFRQNSNHLLFWWYPLNIFWVGGGNHSIMQGIVNAEGEVNLSL